MKLMQSLLSLALAASLVSCASQAPQQEETPKTQKGAEATGKRKVDGHGLKVMADRSRKEKSLHDVLSASGKKVAIYQFAGVDCLSCQEEARELQAKIKAHARGVEILHVVVLTDFFADYTDEEMAVFPKTYAPTAAVVYDEAKLWKHFSANPAEPNRSTILAMNLATVAAVFNTEGEQHKIFTSAVELLP